MTRRDKWQGRPCVLRYRAWADAARIAALSAGGLPADVGVLFAVAYVAIPASLPAKRRPAPGSPCRSGGRVLDASNCLKAVEDALFERDHGIYDSRGVKLWDDGGGPRVEVEVS